MGQSWIPILISILGICFTAYSLYLATRKYNDDQTKNALARQREINIAIDNMRKETNEERKAELHVVITEMRRYADESLARHEKHIETMETHIADIRTQISNIQTKTDLFWQCIERNVASILKTYPSDLEKDILLTKYADGRLTLKDAELLKEILLNELEKKKTEKNEMVFAYVFAIAGLERLIFELEKVNPDVNTKCANVS